MTTTNTPLEAQTIAQALLTDRLAACVQVMPITSYYTWEGTQHQENEYLLLIKGERANFADIQACITAHHSYKVPEVIQIPIVNGSTDYLEWMTAVSK